MHDEARDWNLGLFDCFHTEPAHCVCSCCCPWYRTGLSVGRASVGSCWLVGLCLLVLHAVFEFGLYYEMGAFKQDGRPNCPSRYWVGSRTKDQILSTVPWLQPRQQMSDAVTVPISIQDVLRPMVPGAAATIFAPASRVSALGSDAVPRITGLQAVTTAGLSNSNASATAATGMAGAATPVATAVQVVPEVGTPSAASGAAVTRATATTVAAIASGAAVVQPAGATTAGTTTAAKAAARVTRSEIVRIEKRLEHEVEEIQKCKAVPVGAIIEVIAAILLTLVGIFYRARIRSKYRIRGSTLTDCLAHCCCGPCAISQEAWHVDICEFHHPQSLSCKTWPDHIKPNQAQPSCSPPVTVAPHARAQAGYVAPPHDDYPQQETDTGF